MKNRFDHSFKFYYSFLLLAFVCVEQATASTNKQSMGVVEEENKDNVSKTTLPLEPKSHRKLAKRKHHVVHPSSLQDPQENERTCIDDLSSGLSKLALEQVPSDDLLSFSTPIALDKLWIDFGALPQKLFKHKKTYTPLFEQDTAQSIDQFVTSLKSLVDNQLLLRADNLDLFSALEKLPEDYATLSLFHAQLDKTTRDTYITKLIFTHNDIPAKVSPRYSRFQNQWIALQIIKEEVFDYVTEQSASLKDTELLSAKLIGLTVDMVIPFYDFIKKYKQLILDLEEERAQFFHLMQKHGGITKKTIQFEQAVQSFPSLIGYFKVARLSAEEREAEELRAALEKATLSENSTSIQDFKKSSPSPRQSSAEKETTKHTPSPLRQTFSLDLAWLNPQARKHVTTTGPKNFTSSTGEPSSMGDAKKRFSSPRTHSPTVTSKKRTTSGGDSQSPRERVSLSGETPTTLDSPKMHSSPLKISSGKESPPTMAPRKRTSSPHTITTSDRSKTPPSSHKASAHDSHTHASPHKTSPKREVKSLDPSTEGGSLALGNTPLIGETSPKTEARKTASSPRKISPRLERKKRTTSLEKPSPTLDLKRPHTSNEDGHPMKEQPSPKKDASPTIEHVSFNVALSLTVTSRESVSPLMAPKQSTFSRDEPFSFTREVSSTGELKQRQFSSAARSPVVDLSRKTSPMGESSTHAALKKFISAEESDASQNDIPSLITSLKNFLISEDELTPSEENDLFAYDFHHFSSPAQDTQFGDSPSMTQGIPVPLQRISVNGETGVVKIKKASFLLEDVFPTGEQAKRTPLTNEPSSYHISQRRATLATEPTPKVERKKNVAASSESHPAEKSKKKSHSKEKSPSVEDPASISGESPSIHEASNSSSSDKLSSTHASSTTSGKMKLLRRISYYTSEQK